MLVHSHVTAKRVVVEFHQRVLLQNLSSLASQSRGQRLYRPPMYLRHTSRRVLLKLHVGRDQNIDTNQCTLSDRYIENTF